MAALCCPDETFSDGFARTENLVTGIEARSKLVFTGLALLINLTSPNIYAPVGLAAFGLLTLLWIRVPVRILLLRLDMPLIMAAVVLITQLFFYGKTPLFTVPLLGLVGYEEGLRHGFLIMCRVLGGVSLVLLLSLSTPADKLFIAAGWFKVPRTLIEIALLVYRYIFVLAEETVSMKDAQRLRLGYHGWWRGLKSLSLLGTCLILRAYDRAERVFEAMLVRGYTGASLNYKLTFRRKDGIIASYLALILAGFYLMGRIIA